jgi:hypothetical protein
MVGVGLFNTLLLSCSLLFLLGHFRMSQVCLHMHSGNLRKATTCFSVCLPNRKCNIKLYMIPMTAVACHTVLRPFALVGSLEADVASQENHAVSGVSAPNNFQRWDNSSNCNCFPSMNIADLMHVTLPWTAEILMCKIF